MFRTGEGYFGKYLNKYNGSYIPPGWREWGGLIMNSKYYNYSVNMNGKKIKHGDDYHRDYYPDLIANDSIAFLRASKRRFARKPVLLVMSFPAPHGPEDSAPQYSHLFFNVTTHHTPTYDMAPNPDKQWILRVTEKMKPIHRQFTDLLMTKRLQTLQSVDMAVEKVYQELKALGELDNTYLVYTSDHGYHLGQFGLVKGKSFPFEFDIRVPFLVRGPGVEPGTVVDDIILNIDLAPTFLDMGGVEPPSHMDGRSLLPLLQPRRRRQAAAHWPDTFLVESSGRRETQAHLAEERMRAQMYSREMNGKTTTAHPQEVSSESGDFDDESDDDDFLELDEDDDNESADTSDATKKLSEPLLTNESHNPILEANLEKALDAEEASATNQLDFLGSAGTKIFDQTAEASIASGKAARLAAECSKAELRAPCSVGRKWKCVLVNGRWRRHKCKYESGINAPQPKMSTKKCACFTPSGLVYTRLETDGTILRRPGDNQKENATRSRRSIDNEVFEPNTVEKILEENPSIGHLRFLNEPFNEFENKNTKEKIDELIKETEAYLKAYERTKENIEHKRIKRRAQHFNHNNKHKQKNDLNNATTSNPIPRRYDLNNTDDASEKNKIINTELPKPQVTTIIIERDYDDQNIGVDRTTIRPTRFDASEYEQRNPNKAGDDNLGVFSKPGDIFQRRLHPLFIENEDKHVCYCEENRKPKGPGHAYLEAAQKAREERRKLKEQRLRKKLRKAKKKAELERLCESERMNCFRHDNEHWRTAPLWTAGPFCFCMSSSNNTYNCVRTINATHNLLYCEFVTGLVTYYNLRIDPFETQNRVKYLTQSEKDYFHNQLQQLLSCRGPSCRRFSHSNPAGSSEEISRRFDDENLYRGEPLGYNERAWRWSGYGRRYARARELHRRRHMMVF
ncbi:unnamed protein product, partial [Iphiclides podalirius]